MVQLVRYSSEDTSYEDPIVASELNQLIMYVARHNGLAIKQIDSNGKIKAKHLISEIRHVFELNDEWTSTSQHIKRLNKSMTIYPNLYKTEDYDCWLEKMNNTEANDEK